MKVFASYLKKSCPSAEKPLLRTTHEPSSRVRSSLGFGRRQVKGVSGVSGFRREPDSSKLRERTLMSRECNACAVLSGWIVSGSLSFG